MHRYAILNAFYILSYAKLNAYLCKTKRRFTQGFGNSLNNLIEIYPSADFVEFYYGGSEKYDGMDWRALRLVFEEYKGKPYLIAIVNDQWTI